MSTTLGKRKRVAAPATKLIPPQARASPSDSEDNTADLQDIFRRAFEAKFKPLPVEKKISQEQAIDAEENDSAEDDAWDGLSQEDEEDDTPRVQVVEVGAVTMPEGLSRAEMKAFMSTKVPVGKTKSTTTKSQDKDEEEDEGAEKLNLKNDLALQRLINESHLLDPNSKVAANHRQKLLDMRLQALGAKTSMLKQEKMPMSHRKGIKGRATEKETKRRQEAKENGIILEKVAKSKKAVEKRERGVGGPTVGSFRGGTLRLSKNDVAGMKTRRK